MDQEIRLRKLTEECETKLRNRYKQEHSRIYSVASEVTAGAITIIGFLVAAAILL